MTRKSLPPADPSAVARGLDFLSHPLPGGMRDLLPMEAEDQDRLVSVVLQTFDLAGYQRLSLPAFEYAEVLERGLGAIAPSSILRFVEPETGEVVALRPDVTPQVARLVSTRLADRPGPMRLSYRGSVLRRQHERARHDQQVLQAGIELVGDPGVVADPLGADLEVLGVVTAALRSAGLSDFVLDLGHGAIAQSLLGDLTGDDRTAVLECLSLKDGAELTRRARSAGLSEAAYRPLLELLSLQGGPDVFDRAQQALGGTAAMPHVEELRALTEAVVAAKLAPSLVVDLGETRTVAYYTGAMFQILAEGPGQAVASGGRYDALYGRFGAERPAAGAAIHIDHLRWALGAGVVGVPRRVLVVAVGAAQAGPETEAERRLLSMLREAGIRAAAYSQAGGSDPLDYGLAWRYSHVARLCPDGTAVQLSALQLPAGRFGASQLETGQLEVTGGCREQSLGEMSVEQAVELLRV